MTRVWLPLVGLSLAGCLSQPAPHFTMLARAARTGDLATMRQLLASGVSPNAVDPGGHHWTPLLHAIHKGQLDAVDLLLRSGADANMHVNDLQPLLMAVGTGNGAVVRRLLQAGADPRSDEAILLTAVSGGALSDIDNPLLGRCNDDVARALLERAPDLRLRPGPRTRVALLFAWLHGCSGKLRAAGVKGRAEG
jgi:Ankyrin repeats (3 copies)